MNRKTAKKYRKIAKFVSDANELTTTVLYEPRRDVEVYRNGDRVKSKAPLILAKNCYRGVYHLFKSDKIRSDWKNYWTHNFTKITTN